MKKVPLGISAINSILLTISAILLATGLSGVLNLPDSPLNPILRILGVNIELPKPATLGGAVSIIASIIIFVAVLGLGRGKKWAFFTTISLFTISLVFEALAALSGSTFSILIVLGSLVCLTYLVVSPKIRDFLEEEKPSEEDFTLEMTF